jgi:small-conductance mechanosensitive channel
VGWFRVTAAALVLWCGLAGGGLAQSPPASPQPLPKEQFDALVEAVKRAVAEEFKAQGPPAKAEPAKPGSPSPSAADDADKPALLTLFGQDLVKVLAATPVLIDSLADVPKALDESSTGGRGARSFLLMLLATVAAALFVEAALRAAVARVKERWAAYAIPEKGMRSLSYLLLLALLDGLPVLGLWLTGQLAVGAALPVAALQQRFAYAAVTALLIWRVYALVLRLIVRPDLPAARLCDIDDGEARRFYRRVLVVLAVIIFMRLLVSLLVTTGTPDSAIAASRLVTTPVGLALLLWLVVGSKEAAYQWLGGLGRAARFAGFIGRHWVGIMVPFVVAIVATQFYGAITGHRDVPTALLLTINLMAGLLLFETLLQAFVRRLDSQLAGFTPAASVPTLADIIARCIRVAVLIGVIVLVSESWVVNVLGLVDASAWNHVTREARTAGITLFAAFVAWEMFRYVTDSYMRRHLSGEAASTATRVGTLMPLLRVTVAIVLAIVAVLIALENIGVNITPLLAGASVLGLAVSFGSQTLVKDIVSGIFYLTDDAFRVGEYIDCEKAKGTVESFTLRSVRLRNPNGQIHTVPFGELGHVTNFSRDWAGVDFSLRFARDTDLDKLCKATEKISADLMDVPELKDMLLEPLKMKGIAEVADNALVVRFKFVARPGNPSTVQNEAVSRMVRGFPELGVEFAK